MPSTFTEMGVTSGARVDIDVVSGGWGGIYCTYIIIRWRHEASGRMTVALSCGCHGLRRDKAAFFFDMFDFEGREEASYDEVAICILTVVGAMSKVNNNNISNNNSGSNVYNINNIINNGTVTSPSTQHAYFDTSLMLEISRFPATVNDEGVTPRAFRDPAADAPSPASRRDAHE